MGLKFHFVSNRPVRPGTQITGTECGYTIWCLALAMLLLTVGHGAVWAQAPPDFPTADWQQIKPETDGYSAARLEALRGWLATGPTAAMVVVVHGHMIFSYGDVGLVSKVASVRKSILSMLYGNYVQSGKIDTGKTVEQLGLEEPDRPFLPIEKGATLELLLEGRSGIYLLNPDVPIEKDAIGSSQPRRGSQYPGLYFHYNDWDFNAAGTAFEKLTGKNIYDALETDLARPVGMQDFDRSRQKKFTHPDSIHPEYAMYLSTRDMARLGLLMLRNGNWHGKQLIPTLWIAESASVETPFEEMNPPFLRALGSPERWGFGYMWWTWDASPWAGKYFMPFQGAYEARGTGGQYITVLPARDMVIVHKVDIDKDPRAFVSPEEWDAIVNMVIASTCHGACPEKSQADGR
jgi:CubicO group peptidase (beta-lactamase class C family)